MPLDLEHLLINNFRKVLIPTFIVNIKNCFKKILTYFSHKKILKIFLRPMPLGYSLTFSN